MRKNKRHIRILILMVVSQLLLTTFVTYWLVTQYNAEKNRLTEKLTLFYVDTQDELLDTLLFRSYVDPVISEKKIIMRNHALKDSAFVTPDSAAVSVMHRIPDSAAMGRKSMITVRINQEKDPQSEGKVRVYTNDDTDDMLLRSVRLIVAQAGDSGDNGIPVITQLSMDIDTTLFMDKYYTRLQNAGMNFTFRWSAASPVNGSVSSGSNIVLRPDQVSCLPAVSIGKYKGYIAGNILPQVLFGIVLVLLTAMAFIFSYRSIHDHVILNELRNEFINNISHELKTPVATLGVALESLRKYNLRSDPGLLDEYLKLASIETKRLEELINRVLDHSMLENSSQPLKISFSDINAVIAEVADAMSRRTEKVSIEFTPDEEHIFVNGDPLFLKGAIANIIDNSIKYCDKEPVIKILSRKKEGNVMVEIIDNGPGIPEEYQKKIFEKFFRLPADNVHNVKGYGLGLSFVANVISLHGGSVEVRNLEPGCSFILKIPSA